MNRTRPVRYTLFIIAFALVVIGLITRSYTLLAVMAVLAVVLGLIGDRIENAPTEPYKHLNALHPSHPKEESSGR